MEKENRKSWNVGKLIPIIFLFVVAPLLVNLGLIVTDKIYATTGKLLTAKGLDNSDWLDFWKQYLAIMISFIGICLVHISSNNDRKRRLYERRAERYLESVRLEKRALIDVTQLFNTGVIVDALLKQCAPGFYEGKKCLEDARMNMVSAHIKFELQTCLCDDFRKCDKCKFNVCADKMIMTNLGDCFYKMENDYNVMLDAGEKLLEKINQEDKRIKDLEMQQKIYENQLRIKGINERLGKQRDNDSLLKEIKETENKIQQLKEQQLKDVEVDELYKNLAEKIKLIDQQIRPQFTRLCLDYFKLKTMHVEDIEEKGHICYKKLN